MREERGQLPGNQVISDALELWGSIGGNVTVVEGGKFYLRGAVYGDINVEFGGRIHIFGRVTGNLTVKPGAKAIHSGVLGGNAINLGGRLYIENTATINGKLRPKKGETKVAPLVPPDPTEAPRSRWDEYKRYKL